MGACGQLKCCVKYENNVYTSKRKILPKEGAIIKTLNGDTGKVLKLHLMEEEFELLTDQGKRRRYTILQFNQEKLDPSYVFPQEFAHIVNEISTLIGEKPKYGLEVVNEDDAPSQNIDSEESENEWAAIPEMIAKESRKDSPISKSRPSPNHQQNHHQSNQPPKKFSKKNNGQN